MNRGSVLILTIIAVAILSILVSALLRVGRVEIQTTQNFYLNKSAYYHAVEGTETVFEEIRNSDNPADIISDHSYSNDTTRFRYITGTLKDYQAHAPKPITLFTGFTPPPLPSVSLGSGVGFVPVVWRVQITAEVQRMRKTAFTELESGVYTLMKEY